MCIWPLRLSLYGFCHLAAQLLKTNEGMPIMKYLEKMKRMDYLIQRKATGTPDEFSKKLQINRSTLMRYITELKDLGAPIYFDASRQSYCYEQEGILEFGFRKTEEPQMIDSDDC